MKRAARKWSFWAVSALFVLIVGISVFSMTAKAKSSAGMDETLYYTSYTIRSGETLWSICEDHADPDHYKNTKEYFKTVIELNQISDTEYIESGNHLVLPYYK
ncbi:MAG: LysM peptidoglycan-binding domain-containing protein [Lachnospiraceae bacterium]|nr:LysM peptidoglycan-binding domain-containing protein [Lachnospiraceae bacterium]